MRVVYEYDDTYWSDNPAITGVVQALFDAGVLRPEYTKVQKMEKPLPEPKSTYVTFNTYPLNVERNPYIGNGMPIESNFESMAKAHLGICEDKKDFKKNLNEAVKEYGHDKLIESFYDWSQAQSGVYMGRKPVATFLKNVGQNVNLGKPTVSNPLLDKMEQGVALLTDNKVFFLGEYRVRMAALLREHGLNPVSQAFAEFWSGIEEKSKPWAAREFLQKASVIIGTIQIKEQQALQREQAVEAAYQKAKENVEDVEQEEEL